MAFEAGASWKKYTFAVTPSVSAVTLVLSLELTFWVRYGEKYVSIVTLISHNVRQSLLSHTQLQFEPSPFSSRLCLTSAAAANSSVCIETFIKKFGCQMLIFFR